MTRNVSWHDSANFGCSLYSHKVVTAKHGKRIQSSLASMYFYIWTYAPLQIYTFLQHWHLEKYLNNWSHNWFFFRSVESVCIKLLSANRSNSSAWSFWRLAALQLTLAYTRGHIQNKLGRRTTMQQPYCKKYAIQNKQTDRQKSRCVQTRTQISIQT